MIIVRVCWFGRGNSTQLVFYFIIIIIIIIYYVYRLCIIISSSSSFITIIHAYHSELVVAIRPSWFSERHKWGQ